MQYDVLVKAPGMVGAYVTVIDYEDPGLIYPWFKLSENELSLSSSFIFSIS